MVKDIHVVMLPWSAFGHMIPFLQLSISLAKAGVHVTFVSTPYNIQRLPKLPANVASLIDLVALPMPAIGLNLLPEGAEATTDVPFEKIQYLKVAYDLLQQPFRQLIADRLPDWIFVDVIPHWAVDIAQECGVPLIFFSAFSVASIVFVGSPDYLLGDGHKNLRPTPESLTSPPEWVTFPSEVAFRIHEAIGMQAGFFGENATGITDAHRLGKILQACRATAFRTCTELEGDYLDVEAKITAKPAIPVGLLPPELPEKREIGDGSWTNIFKWLDEQKPRSVVFVGFGSECKLTKDQVHEIAHGLELSELPFFWALRKPSWVTGDLGALPAGFSHRTSAKGMVHMGWVPQTDILAHPSVGGSLFHAGWGSAIETLQYGHCLVLLPFMADQPLNARALVDKGVGFEVERREDGSFSRDDLAKCLRRAMLSKEGEELRARTMKAAEIFGDRKLHDRYIHQFVEYLKNGVGNCDIVF